MFREVDCWFYLSAVCVVPLASVFGLCFLDADATNMVACLPSLALLVVYLVWFLGGRRSAPLLYGAVHGLLISAVFFGGVWVSEGFNAWRSTRHGL